LLAMIAKSILYRYRSLGKGEPFPPEAEWGGRSLSND